MARGEPTPLGILVSRSDRVAERIWSELQDLATWSTAVDECRPAAAGGGEYYRTAGAIVRTIAEPHLHFDAPGRAFDADLARLVFPSRHAGETGPLLTAHFTGNVDAAEHGGAERELARAAPIAGKRAIRALDRHAPAAYDVAMECTHHGPSDIEIPSLYVELGSGDPHWSDETAARAVARAVLACRVAPHRVESGGHHPAESTSDLRSSNGSAEGGNQDADSGSGGPPPAGLPGHRVVGIGGSHYAPKCTRIARETSWAVGHVAADWGLAEWSEPDRDVLDQLFDRSAARLAVVEGDRPTIESAVADLGYQVVDESWLRATSGVALEIVTRCIEQLCAVDDGLRFGTPAKERTRGALKHTPLPTLEFDEILPDTASVRRLPTALIEETAGIDLDRTRRAVVGQALAFETTEAGNRPTGRVLLPAKERFGPLIDGLETILEDKYDHVERTTDAVVAERTVFDPDRASTLGVPEGPAFGRLAAGESVTVDSREIEPDVVSTTERRRFPLGP